MKYNKLFIIILFILISALNTGALDFWSDAAFSGFVNQIPFWLKSNRWGEISPDSMQLALGIGASQSLLFSEWLSLDLKADLSTRIKEDPDFYIREVYGKLKLSSFYLSGGVFQDTRGELPDESLSSGRMVISGNAPPIPKITFASDGFVPVPFTQEQLLVKGGISHGWFSGERYIDGPLLHEKWAYAKIQRKDIFSIHFGLIHEGIWAGFDPDGNGGSPSWDSFLGILLGRQSAENPDLPDWIGLEGNHLGIWDIGSTISFDRFDLNLYKHHYFEDSTGLLKIRNFRDGLWGINIETEYIFPFLDSILFERVYTWDQSGDYHNIGEIILGGRDVYYSHYFYKSGWTNDGWINGNPFILTAGEGEDLRIAGNRIFARHIGIRGHIGKCTEYIVKFSKVQYKYPFTVSDVKIPDEENERLYQYHYYGGITHDLDDKPLSVDLAFGLDHGDVSPFNLGVLFNVRYNF
jgi:hypothetical protein